MESSSQFIPILWNLFAAVLGALGQWMYKSGSQSLAAGAGVSWKLLAGVLLFCGVMVCFVMAYKAGGKISVVYPFYATTFIWGAVIAVAIEKEPFQWGAVLGTAVIILGLVIIAQTVRS